MTNALDRAGTVASSLCAIHCALVALLPALPATLLGFLARGWTEALLIAVAVAVGVSAIAVAFVRVHRDVRPTLLLLAGLLALSTRSLLHLHGALEVTSSIVGAGCLVAAHRLNARLSGQRCCDGCAPARDDL